MLPLRSVIAARKSFSVLTSWRISFPQCVISLCESDIVEGVEGERLDVRKSSRMTLNARQRMIWELHYNHSPFKDSSTLAN